MAASATVLGLVLAVVMGFLALAQIDALQTELRGLTTGALNLMAGNLMFLALLVLGMVAVGLLVGVVGLLGKSR